MNTAVRSLPLSIVLLFVSLAVGCRSGPPRVPGPFARSDLIELAAFEPGLRLDVRYATTNNFLGRPVYGEARAFLQRPAAEALVRAHRRLQVHGYGLVVFDGYRPWSVTRSFWRAASREQRRIGFVANPRQGSRHNRGCAVDVTLYHLDTGREAIMPSGYDEFGERAHTDYPGGPAEARARRDLLRATMEAEGFAVLPEEWWHFDYRDWRQYPVLDIPFESFGDRNRN